MAIFRRFFGNAGSNAAGYAIGAAVHPTLRPLTQQVVNETWPRFPFVPLTPEQAAAAVERGEMSYADAQDEALLSGTNTSRFRIVERLAGLAPSTEQLLSLRRRGAINDERLHKGLIQGNVRSEWSDALMKLSEQLLSTGELANMVVQGVLTEAAATELAGLVGVVPANFHRLVQLAGSPIGGHEALDLWNRGDIAEADVDRALRQSHLKPEWVEPFKALKRYLPSVSDYVRFAVREVFSPDIRRRYGLDDDFPQQFADLAAQRGLSPDDAKAYWAAHWELPSIEQGYRMRWRGIIDDEGLATLLRTKDVMPFWRDKLEKVANLVPGRIDLRRFYSVGLITEQEVFEGYKALGYNDQHARWQTDFAKRGSNASAKEATAANLRAEYEGLFIDRTTLLAGLKDLGYAEHDAEILADLGDAARVKKYRDAVVTATYKAYLGHDVLAGRARILLGDVGIGSEAATELLKLWDAELSVARKQLTPAQIASRFRRATLSRDDALAELEDHGYSVEDAAALLGLAAPELTVAQIQAAYKAGNLTRDEAIGQLRAEGYSEAQAVELVDTAVPPPTPPPAGTG